MSRRRNPTFVHHRRFAPLFFDFFNLICDAAHRGDECRITPSAHPTYETELKPLWTKDRQCENEARKTDPATPEKPGEIQ
jgi:hypothetical protein